MALPIPEDLGELASGILDVFEHAGWREFDAGFFSNPT